MSKYVPYATRKRLPIYYKMFKNLAKIEVKTITSFKLAKLINIDANTIRQDFSTIGTLGKKGVGYSVNNMLVIFENEFDLSKSIPCVIVGIGNLGSAIIEYFFKEHSFVYINQIYDTDKNKIGRHIHEVDVLDYNNIKETFDPHNELAIIAVPQDKAQQTFIDLYKLGIRGFVNFSGAKIYTTNTDVYIRDIDILNEIQSLIYDLKANV